MTPRARIPFVVARWTVAAAAVIACAGALATAAAALPPNPPSASASRTALAKLTVHAATSQASYARSKFGSGWISQGNGCDTRDRVLLRDGLGTMASVNCTITAAHWRSIYDGAIITARSQVQIDHIVPLAKAWRSGASGWTRARRVRFANDLTDPQLIAVSASSNTSKGDRGPEAWKPPRRRVWCLYARWWIDVKTAWALTVTGKEKGALRTMLNEC
jgi:uncharacterized protein DUF1524